MSPEEAIRHALDGNAILFTGAGFSWGAKNQNEQKIPAGAALAESLLDEVGHKKSQVPLDKASTAYLRRKNPKDLVEYLVPRFTASSVTESHRVVARVPFRRVYTTNYDDVLEMARREVRLPYASFEAVDSPREVVERKGLILHINGSISNLTENKLHKSFKLTSGSYAAESFENTDWAFHFRQDIRSAKAIIFIGYSMYDLDIRRIVFGEDVSDRCIFVTAPFSKDNELDAEDLNDVGAVLEIGVDAFAEMIGVVGSDYVPQESEIVVESWARLLPPQPQEQLPSDQDVIDALVYGLLGERLVSEALGPGASRYVIPRTQLNAIKTDVLSGVPAVIIGDLGSGKSFIIDILGREFARDGIDVFNLVSSDHSVEEAIFLSGQGRKVLLVVESYYRHIDLMRWVGELRPSNVMLLLTARPSAHDLFQADLIRIFSGDIRLHEISQLDAHELQDAIALFDAYGFWGDKFRWPAQRKFEYLRKDCTASLAPILVDILKSQNIIEKYRVVIKDSAARGDFERVLICVFVLEAMGFVPTVPKVQELLSHSVMWAGIRAESNLRSVINFDANIVRARSSVLAINLLHHVLPLRRIVDAMIEMARAADRLRSSNEYFQILNEMMRYGNVNAILPEQGRREATISFYEGVKNLPSAKRNPQFWLQYAIACLAIGRLERSGRYFKVAYSLVYDGYDTSKIDNHYARFLIESALSESDFNDAKGMIDKAAGILLQQMASEVKYYPYRVALGVFKFYEKFRTQCGPADKQSFKKIFSQIEKRSSAIRGPLAKNRYVIDCHEKAVRFLIELGP